MSVVLEGKAEAKLTYLTSPMVASKTSGKSTYASSSRFFYKGEGSQSGLMVEAMLAFALVVCPPDWSKGWIERLCFPYGHSAC